MPSIIPSYVYSLFAALVVGSIIVYSCSLATMGMQDQAMRRQLSNIDEYVATQGLALLSHTTQADLNRTQFLEIPATVGNQRFWVQIANDSGGGVVQSGFGINPSATDIRIAMPAEVAASGYFVSGSGRAMLVCSFENQVATLRLTMGD